MDSQTKSPEYPQVVSTEPGLTIHYSPKDPPFTGGIPPRPPMGPKPHSMVCKNCERTMATELLYRSSTKTHLCALALCLIGFWPCVCMLYCFNTCKNIDHYCPYCATYVGTYSA